MADETPLALWLRTEMPRRGYPLEGPRAGGITRLADDAEISRASMSRIVAGRAEASIEALRKIGHVLGYTLGEMLVHAGYADPDDLNVITPATTGAEAPPVGVPAHVSLPDLEPWERHIWVAPGLTTPEKEVAILLIRLRRGVLTDDEGLLRLYHALGKVVEHRLGIDDPPQAV